MRKILIIFWFLIPVAVAAYHYGPGQDQLKLDAARSHMWLGEFSADDLEYEDALEHLDKALELLPDEEAAAINRIRLEKAKIQMDARQLPEAHNALGPLLADLEKDEDADPVVVAGAREALANSQYYMTWLMRLEGLGRDVWGPEIEASRQHYRLLAEAAVAAGDGTAEVKHRESLESAIRLARMDLSELQGLPLPSQ